MTGRIGAFVFVALALLFAAVGAQYLARMDDVARPTADSIRPSGAGAFAQLLREKGYRVRVDKGPKPVLKPGEVGIVFQGSEELPGAQKAHDSVLASVRKGAGMVVLPLPDSFDRSVRASERKPVKVWRRTDFAERTLATTTDGFPPLKSPSQVLYYDADTDVVSMARRGKGTVVAFSDGTLATNRLIDKGDNAQVLLEAVAVAGSDGSVVFTEATFSGETPGLLATLGSWAQALVYQSLFLFAVAVFTLGRRFGLEDVIVRRTRSTRDIANAISDTLDRGRMAGVALGILLEDRERIKGEKPSAEMRRLLNDPKLPEEEALKAARELL